MKHRRIRFGRIAACVLAVVSAVPLVGGGGEKAPPSFEPDLETAAANAKLEDQTWHGEAEGWALWLTWIDDATRQAYIRKVTGVNVDPFGSPPDKAPGFASFLLEIENRGTGELTFNPLQSWLFTNKQEVQTPMGLSDLGFEYRITGGELPGAYEQVGPLLLTQSRAIQPGEWLQGLLVYRNVKPGTKRLSVRVQLSLPDGDVLRFDAPYRRIKKTRQTDEP